jgi:hypothetical protein
MDTDTIAMPNGAEVKKLFRAIAARGGQSGRTTRRHQLAAPMKKTICCAVC